MNLRKLILWSGVFSLTLSFLAYAAETSEPSESAPEINVSSTRLDGKTPKERQAALLLHCATLPLKNIDKPKHAVSAFLPRVLLEVEVAAALKQWEETARRTFETARDQLAANPANGHALDPFDKQALLEAWLLAKDRTSLPPEIEANTKHFISLWSHREWKGYGAMNYRLMMDGSGFLAAEQWPDLKDADGLNAEEIKAATKGRLLGYFDDIVHHNHHEYGAPTYGGVDLSAMKMLADFAQDTQVRDRATLTLDWMLLNVACAWNQGYHVTPAGRAKYLGSTITSPNAMDQTATIGWIYFGAHRPIQGDSAIHSFWFGCPGRYQPPAILTQIAQDRSQSFTHRGSLKNGHTDVRYTIYHTPQYSLASQVEFLSGPTDGLYKETRRQMLKWISDFPFSTFSPMQENPQRPYALKENKANAFGYGENPFGQVVQDGATLLGLCCVPLDYPYFKTYVPFSVTGSIHRRLERDGWICCHTGSMLFGFKPLQPAHWDKPRPKEGCDVLVSEERCNGWILETSERAAYAGGDEEKELSRFAQALVDQTKIEALSWERPSPRFSYKGLSGRQVQMEYRPHGVKYDCQHQIKGEPISYSAFPLLGNPWVHQELDGDTLRLEKGKDVLEYNFKIWTRTP